MIDPYSKITTVAFWTDDYIAKQMLKYHLDVNTDAASRKLETIEKTVEFISGLLKNKMNICDYGCGPGLYTNLLSKKGFNVIGVDVSKNSLEYAMNHNKDVEYLNINYTEEKISRNVDLAMMIYCDFGALDPVSQIKVLKNIHDTLEEKGLFFFDVMSHKHFDEVTESYNDYIELDGFYMSGECKITSRTVKYPNLKLILSNYYAVGNKELDIYNWDKCYDETEMKVLLIKSGFEVVEVFSDTMGNKDFISSNTIAFLCRKKP